VIAIAAPPFLALMMYGVFQVLAQFFGRFDVVSWFRGILAIMVHWLPYMDLGQGSFHDLFRSKKLDMFSFLLLVKCIIFNNRRDQM